MKMESEKRTGGNRRFQGEPSCKKEKSEKMK